MCLLWSGPFIAKPHFHFFFPVFLKLSPEQWKNGKDGKKKESWEANRNKKRRIFMLSVKNRRCVLVLDHIS